MKPQTDPQIAFIHDWLVTYGGGEQVLRSLLEIWDEAPIYTLVHDPDGPCGIFTQERRVETSFIQNLPRSKKNHRTYLPLMPLAIEQFDIRGYELLVSVSHAVSHGIVPQPGQYHINYICIPIRYAWHLYHQYLEESGLTKGIKASIAKVILHYIRMWDAAAATRVDQFVAISNWVAQNVWRVYRRKADVIYPPVDIKAFRLHEKKEDFYLTVSRLVPYKRVDLIVDAFAHLSGKKLVVIGDGPEREKLESQASDNVEFLGYQSDQVLREYMQRAQAFLFAPLEDFGIVPVEAQACGTPVIAYGKGGVLETVVHGKTGLLFPRQTTDSLVKTIQAFESGELTYNPIEIRRNAERFSKKRFQKEFSQYVERKWDQLQNLNRPLPG